MVTINSESIVVSSIRDDLMLEHIGSRLEIVVHSLAHNCV